MGLMKIFKREEPVITLESERESLQEAQRYFNDQAAWMTERLAELEFQLEDQGWQRLTGENNIELSRRGLKQICALSRIMYLKNPLINRAVNLQASYVFGQGVVIQSSDEGVNAKIQAFMDDPTNKAELTSHKARMLKDVDLTTLGNIFFVLFRQQTTGDVKIRTIPVDEVDEIICNPEDVREVWYYKRMWSQKTFNENGTYGADETKTAYYPDWRFARDAQGARDMIGNDPIMWDAPVYHLKSGGMSDMRFGIPETYASLDWARAYKEFLEDWATITRALSKFAWQMKTPNGARGVAAAKTKLNTLLGNNNTAGDRNPPPLAGSTFVASDGYNMDPMKIGGANVSAEDGRRLLLMVAAGTGFPETFFGDAQVGTLATAKSLDRPTELKMIDRRTVWSDFFKEILEWVVSGPEQMGEIDIPDENLIDIDWPPLLEHDIKNAVDAIVSAATLDGKRPAGNIDFVTMTRLLFTALGMDDIDEELKEHPPEYKEPPAPTFGGSTTPPGTGVGGPDNQPRNPGAQLP